MNSSNYIGMPQAIILTAIAFIILFFFFYGVIKFFKKD